MSWASDADWIAGEHAQAAHEATVRGERLVGWLMGAAIVVGTATLTAMATVGWWLT